MGPKGSKKNSKITKYTSKHTEKIQEEIKKAKSPHKSLGPVHTKPDPKNFKNQDKSKVSNVEQNLNTSKRYIENSKNKERQKIFQDVELIKPTPSNSVNRMGKAEEKFINNLKKNKTTNKSKDLKLGKIPNYVKKYNEEKRNSTKTNHVSNNQMSESEKFEILNGLKSNWEKVNKQYQTMSVVLDTPSKKRRKLELEDTMTQLESSIELLQKSKTIILV